MCVQYLRICVYLGCTMGGCGGVLTRVGVCTLVCALACVLGAWMCDLKCGFGDVCA